MKCFFTLQNKANADRLAHPNDATRTRGMFLLDTNKVAKATVTPDRTISGSYDWLRLGHGATDRQCLLRSPATAGRIPRSTSMRCRATMNDRRKLMATAIVGNRATIGGSDHRPMYDQSLRPATDATTNMIVASSDRSYEHSWHRVTKRTINRGTRLPMVRPIVGCNNRSYDQWWLQMIWNRRLDVLNMTIELATTDFALAINHDLCDQSYVLSTICPIFQPFSVAGRNPGVSPV